LERDNLFIRDPYEKAPVSSHTVWVAGDPVGYIEDYARIIYPKLFPGGDNYLKYHIKLK